MLHTLEEAGFSQATGNGTRKPRKQVKNGSMEMVLRKEKDGQATSQDSMDRQKSFLGTTALGKTALMTAYELVRMDMDWCEWIRTSMEEKPKTKEKQIPESSDGIEVDARN